MTTTLRFVTLAEIRSESGVPIALISDSDLSDIAARVEFETERFLSTKFAVTRKIERQDPNKKDTTYVSEGPLLSLKYLKVNGEDIDMEAVVYERSGKVSLLSTSQVALFIGTQPLSIVLDYYYGYLEEGSTQTTTSGAVTAGTNKVLTGSSPTSFSINDYVVIEGRDGNREVAKVTSVTTNLTVDELIYDHATAALITKLELPVTVKRLMILNSAIASIANIIASKYGYSANYTIGEFAKSNPHISDTFIKHGIALEKERNDILSRVNPFPAMRG